MTSSNLKPWRTRLFTFKFATKLLYVLPLTTQDKCNILWGIRPKTSACFDGRIQCGIIKFLPALR